MMDIKRHRLGSGDPHAEKVGFEILHASGIWQKPYHLQQHVKSCTYGYMEASVAPTTVHTAHSLVQSSAGKSSCTALRGSGAGPAFIEMSLKCYHNLSKMQNPIAVFAMGGR